MVPKLEIKITSTKIMLFLLIIVIVGLCSVYIVLSTTRLDGSSSNKHSAQKIRVPRATTTLRLRVDNSYVADVLEQTVRVLCWVMTFPANHKDKAIHIKKTWGKRCNVLLFMSSETDNDLPTIKLPVQEGRDFLWSKTSEAFKYVYNKYRDEADWFLKTDDDTYVFMENLRYLLSQYDSKSPFFFGYLQKRGFMDGGAGYVLSRSALDALLKNNLTKKQSRFEDVEMSYCMEQSKVPKMDSRDALRRNRFFSFQPITHIFKNKSKSFLKWYKKRRVHFEAAGFNCCSEYSISFHYIPPYKMYELEYLMYRLRPYGITYKYNISLHPSYQPRLHAE